jgi:hypothetical protein
MRKRKSEKVTPGPNPEPVDKSKLEWRFDRIRILSKGKDLSIPLWNGDVETKCTPEGGDIYSSGKRVECCEGLSAFTQDNGTPEWPIKCYKTKEDCESQGKTCEIFSG